MTAYMLVQGTISDEERYGRRRQAVVPPIETPSARSGTPRNTVP